MPAKGGKKTKRFKKDIEPNTAQTPFADADELQVYAVAKTMLGNRRLIVKCADEKERMAIIPGKFKGRKYWVGVGTVLLLNLREYEDGKSDVIYVYSAAETKVLRKAGEITFGEEKEEKDDGFVFDDSDNDQDDFNFDEL